MNYFEDIHFTHVGKSVNNKNNLPPLTPIRHDRYYGMGLMLGKDVLCRTIYPDNKVIIKMPFFYLIHPDLLNASWQSVNGTVRENRWFIFEGERGIRMVESLMEHMTICSCILPLKNFSELVAIHQKMLYLFQSGIPSENHQLAVCAEMFMGALYNAMNVPDMKAPTIQAISDLIKEITEEPGKEYDYKAIAAKYKMSYYHFRRCFVQYTGIPLHEYILQKRFTLAISLLKNGTATIKEIADQCGFHTSSDFSRFIKERSGSTPSELRKRPQFMDI